MVTSPSELPAWREKSHTRLPPLPNAAPFVPGAGLQDSRLVLRRAMHGSFSSALGSFLSERGSFPAERGTRQSRPWLNFVGVQVFSGCAWLSGVGTWLFSGEAVHFRALAPNRSYLRGLARAGARRAPTQGSHFCLRVTHGLGPVGTLRCRAGQRAGFPATYSME